MFKLRFLSIFFSMHLFLIPAAVESFFFKYEVGERYTKEEAFHLITTGNTKGGSLFKLSDETFGRFGVGAYPLNCLSVDVTASTRGKIYSNSDLNFQSELKDSFLQASMSAFFYLGTANIYLDRFFSYPIWCSPFISGGVGFSHFKVKDILSNITDEIDFKQVLTENQRHFAWNVGFGVSCPFSRALTGQLGYRYLDLGEAKTGIKNEMIKPVDSLVQFPCQVHEFYLSFLYFF